MANAIGSIYIGLYVDTARSRALGTVADSVVRDSNKMRTALGNTSRSVTQLRSQMGQGFRMRLFNDVLRQASQANNEVAKLRATMLAITAVTGTSVTAGFAGAFLLQTADAANRLNNQLRTVTDSEENLVAIRKRLHDISQLTRSDMQATVTLYARNTRAARDFGKTQEEMLRVTETIQKAFAIGGASQAEASGAAIQLSQGIASDRFSGDEFRSVAENAPVLLQEMAKHLDVSIGKLREMAHAGELTGKTVIEAIEGASAAIDRDFNKTIPTVGQSLTRLNNAFLQNIGDIDTSYGLTRRLSEAMSNLAENFGEVAKYAGVAGAAIAGIFLARGAAKGTSGAAGGIMGWLGGVSGKGVAADLRTELREIVRQRNALKGELAGLQKEITGKAGGIGGPATQAGQAFRPTIGPAMGISMTKQQVGLIAQYNEKMSKVDALNQRAATATMKATKAMGAFAVAGRAVGSVMSFVGGPVGVAFLAAAAGIGIMTAHMAALEERTNRTKKELHDLGLITDEVAGITEKAAKSLDQYQADELRNQLRDLREEMERQRGQQNPLEKLFGLDPKLLGNMVSQIDQAMLINPEGITMFDAGLPDDIKAVAQQIRGLVKQTQEGSISAEDLAAQLDKIAAGNPNLPKWLDTIITNLRLQGQYLEGAATQAERLQAALAAIGNEADTGWIEQMIAAQEATSKAVAAAKTVHEAADQMVKEAGFSDEEARLEKVIAALQKEAAARGDIEGLLRGSLEMEAKRIIAAEDAADQRKKEAKAAEDLAEKIADLKGDLGADGLKLIDRDTGAEIANLLDQFQSGDMQADTLRRRLEEISKVGLSDEMQKLIEKIISAIPQLATLLSIFRSFDATGGGPAGPTYGRGAVGRSRRRITAMQGAGQGVADEAIRVAGLSERDAFIEDKANDLQSDAKTKGGILSADAAKATATELWNLKQAQDAAKDSSNDAADAAKKYAEGMQDLRDEVALAPLGEFASKVFEAADAMGFSREELDAFIASVSSGGLDAAPAKFREIAKAMQEVAFASKMSDLKFEAEQMFRSDVDQDIFSTLRDMGLEIDSTYGRIVAGQMRLIDQMRTAKDLAKDFFGGLVSDLMNGVSFTEALGNAFSRLGEKLISMAMDQAINQFLSAIIGTAFGGGFGGGNPANLGTGIGFGIPIAKGGVFSGAGISRYSNSIASSPTLFPLSSSGLHPFAKGVGLMGEAGPEAIMPLRRGPDGRLGVLAATSGLSEAGGLPPLEIHNHITLPPGANPETAPIFAREFARELRAQLPDALAAYDRNPMRRSGRRAP